MPFDNFYENRRVLVTGSTGFKGSWLSLWLKMLGADVYGIGLEPNTSPSLFSILQIEDQIEQRILDIRDAKSLRDFVGDLRPDVVFHLAAQALVRRSYETPLDTLASNFMGTANLLQAIGHAGYSTDNPCSAVIVTSDKCYENRETHQAYREEDPVGGHDIYSMSKGAVELLVSSWRRSFFTPNDGEHPAVLMASCRAGNVIGGGDWAADRIVADCVRSLVGGQPIRVRNPLSIRPWQHVLEPLSGYLQVGALLGAHSGTEGEAYRTAWNFGPGRDSERTVGELCDEIVDNWGSGSWQHIPERRPAPESKSLKLAIDKARHYLNWTPVWDFKKAIRQTVGWYRSAYEAEYDSARTLSKTRMQIEQFTHDASARSLPWTK